MFATLFRRTFRWAKMWGICGGVLLAIAVVVRSSAAAVDGVDLIEGIFFGGVLGAFYGALAGLSFGIITLLDSNPGSRVPLGIIAGGLSGFLCMRINVGTIVAPIAGTLLGFMLAKTDCPRAGRTRA